MRLRATCLMAEWRSSLPVACGRGAPGIGAGQRRHRRRHPRQGDGRDGSSRPSGPIRPGPDATSRPGRCSATRTCTPCFSFDAGAFGARLSPRDAYRFAKGEEIIASSGQPRSSRGRSTSWSSPTTPTTWASSRTSSPASPRCSPTRRAASWYDMIQSGKGAEAAVEMIIAFSQGNFPPMYSILPGHAGLPVGLARDDRRRRGGQRSRPLHRLHRL